MNSSLKSRVHIHAITHEAAGDTIQSIQQAFQAHMHKQAQVMQLNGLEISYAPVQYYAPHYIVEDTLYFSTIPFGVVYHL
ncbi:DUF3947 family protein [Bacillus manliponensis]|uniref:DUF3947 family protein n=1 Tax=Bacillus manliponensis TaxID=574376 RepID=UPI0035180329